MPVTEPMVISTIEGGMVSVCAPVADKSATRSPGFAPRRYHPASGGFSAGSIDFAQPLDSALDQRWQPRFRLQKTDPGAAVSDVVKPIVFYLDRGTPEPVRSALLDGARWWASAFEQAGFRDAFRVELMPAGAEVTVPVPVPARATAMVGLIVKVAVTAVAALTVIAQVPVPEQPPPLQPAKVEPIAGVAVRVTAVPLS